MSVNIQTREVDGVTVVSLAGRITLGEATGKVREAIRNLVEKGCKNLLLDLSQLEYLDSAGLGEVVGAYTTVANAGGKLKLLKVGGRALDLLQVTKMTTIFEFFETEEEAVRSFA